MKTQREFSQFEQASAYAKELARKISSTVAVLRHEKGWIVTHETASHQIPYLKKTESQERIKLSKNKSRVRRTRKTRKERDQKFTKRCEIHTTSGPKDHVCVDCGNLIPQARREAIPNVPRCVKCQSLFEKQNPSISKRKVDEGIAGSREDNKKMSARQWSDMIRRHRE